MPCLGIKRLFQTPTPISHYLLYISPWRSFITTTHQTKLLVLLPSQAMVLSSLQLLGIFLTDLSLSTSTINDQWMQSILSLPYVLKLSIHCIPSAPQANLSHIHIAANASDWFLLSYHFSLPIQVQFQNIFLMVTILRKSGKTIP